MEGYQYIRLARFQIVTLNGALARARATLSTALIITRRELKDSLRDWRIVSPIALLTLIFPWLTMVAAQVMVEFAQRYNATVVYLSMIPFSIMIVGFFPISFSLVIALETFVGEKERYSLEPLLSMPISDGELYLGKLLAAIILPLAASYLGMGTYTIGLRWFMGYQVPLSLLLQFVLLTGLKALIMVAGAVVVSSHTTSTRAANLLASFIIIPVALLVQVESVLLLWNRYWVLWYIMAILVVASIIIIRMGIRIFNREEILARENDELSLALVWSRLKRYFTRLPGDTESSPQAGSKPISLGRIYGQDIPHLLYLNRLPIAVVVGIMLVGIGIGGYYAWRFPLPSGLLNLDDLTGKMFGENLNDMPSVAFLPEFSTWGIFLHNLRAMVLAALLALFSFGTMALLLLMIPMGLVGFFAGEVFHLGYNPLLFFASFILPHGIIELPAAIIATAFALRMGASIMAPQPGLTVGESLLAAFADFLKVFFFLVVPLLVIAAFIEATITPQVVLWVYGGL